MRRGPDWPKRCCVRPLDYPIVHFQKIYSKWLGEREGEREGGGERGGRERDCYPLFVVAEHTHQAKYTCPKAKSGDWRGRGGGAHCLIFLETAE